MFPISDSIPARRFPFITVALIAINVFVFFQQIVTPDTEAFVATYALIPSKVNFANPATLFPFITSMFLHGGFLHIISNMWFLWVFGDNVEGYLGTFKYLLLYFASGILGSLAQFLLMRDSPIPTLGASGAIAGVLGAYYVMFPESKIKTLLPVFGFISFVTVSAPFMLGYWFILQVISGAVSLPSTGSMGGVAFFAHIGGFIAGFVLAKILKPRNIDTIEGSLA